MRIGIEGLSLGTEGKCFVLSATVAAVCVACGGAAPSRADGPGQGGAGWDSGTGGTTDGGGGGDTAASSLAGRWWGVFQTGFGPTPVVMEVLPGGSSDTLPVHFWDASGSPIAGTLSRSGSGWQLSSDACWFLSPRAASTPDTFDVSNCGGQAASPIGILRRSRATRIYDAPVTASALNFDPTGTHFGFTTGNHFWLWDGSGRMRGDLGSGTTVPYGQIGIPLASLVFSPDGQRVAYLRSGQTTRCTVADLVLYDSVSGQEQVIAAGVPCGGGFAQFSPSGDALVYFANYENDGSGADLSLWSVADGAATVIAPGMNIEPRDEYLFFAPSGRRLVYRSTSPQYGAGWNEYEALSIYDLTTRRSTVLASAARDVTPAANGALVAFGTQTGQVAVWSDADGSVAMLDVGAAAVDDFYRSGLSASADGHWFAYLGTDGAGHVYDTTNRATATLGAGGIACYTETLPLLWGASYPTLMRAAHFAPSVSGLVYWPTPSRGTGGCYAGDPATLAFHYLDLDLNAEITGPTEMYLQAFGPRAEIVGTTMQASIWSPSRGTTALVDTSGAAVPTPASLAVVFRDDSSQMVFAGHDAYAASPLWAWSAATARATQIAPTLPIGAAFRFQADPISGQVVFPATGSIGLSALKLYDPGADAATQLLDPVDTPVWSPSGRVMAARMLVTTHTRPADEGIYVFRFGTTMPVLIEEGQILGVSETQIYFDAPDGVCVVDL